MRNWEHSAPCNVPAPKNSFLSQISAQDSNISWFGIWVKLSQLCTDLYLLSKRITRFCKKGEMALKKEICRCTSRLCTRLSRRNSFSLLIQYTLTPSTQHLLKMNILFLSNLQNVLLAWLISKPVQQLCQMNVQFFSAGIFFIVILSF